MFAVVLASAAIAAVFWHRRLKAAQDALLQQQKHQQDQHNKLHSQLEEGSGGGFTPSGSAYGKGPNRGQLAPHGRGVALGLLGHRMGM
jgi:hypothetical protein